VTTLSSPYSGIKLEIFTDQDAFQVYTCNFQDGTTPLKKTQGFFGDAKHPRTIQKYGCLVMEVQEWIDGINHPEWGRMEKQVFGPGEGNPFVLKASYRFSVEK
jgi:aldose 1-epimerase